MGADGIECVLGAAGDEVAAGAISGGDDFLVEADGCYAEPGDEGFWWARRGGGVVDGEVGIFAPGVSGEGEDKRGDGDEEMEKHLETGFEHEEGKADVFGEDFSSESFVESGVEFLSFDASAVDAAEVPSGF